MKKIICIYWLFLFLIGCYKSEVTKIAPQGSPASLNGHSTPLQNQQDNQVEGTINGGGGKGVLCKKNGATTVEVLDLYEAKILYGLDIKYEVNNQEDAQELLINLMSKHLWNPSSIPMEAFKKEYEKLLKSMLFEKIKFINSDKKLKATQDSFEPLIEKDCQLVQIAVYYDESILLVDQSLWEKLDWVNKMALMAHEIFYLLDRQNGSNNSMASRKLVGQLFSTKGARPKSDGTPLNPSQYSDCTVFDKSVVVGFLYLFDSDSPPQFSRKDRGVTMNFNFLKNSAFLFHTSAFFSRFTLKSIFQETVLESDESPLYVEGYSPRQNINVNFVVRGRGKFVITENSTRTLSGELDIVCDRPKNSIEQ